MVSNVMNEIILAESKAAEKVESANKESEQIILKANEKAKEIIKNAKQECKIEADKLLQQNKILTTEILDKSNKKSINESSDIKAKTQANKEKAIDMVIEKIISK